MNASVLDTLNNNVGMIKALEVARTEKGVAVIVGKGHKANMSIGYDRAQATTRLLAEDSTTTTTQDAKISATGLAGILVSVMVALITIFALVMMADIQTPKSFAKRDLIKGKVNK